jgi:hypothetical protein
MSYLVSHQTGASTADADAELGKKKFFKRLRMLELVLRLPGTSKGPALLLERLLFKYLQEGKEDGRVVEYCFPSDPTLINDTKMKKDELKRCMLHLRKVGIIDWKWVGRKRYISFGWFLLEEKPTAVTTKEQGPRKIEKPEGVECPHCKKTGSTNAMRRWHFDRCKRKPVPFPKIARAETAVTSETAKGTEWIKPRLEELTERMSDDERMFVELFAEKDVPVIDTEEQKRKKRLAEDVETRRREEEQRMEALRMLEQVERANKWVQ